ncbi:MAG: hypothetical protein ACP5NW_03425 [Candidatus Woesearchaeota archaeon]
MRIPKRYGESRIENCPFCGRQAIINNPQGVPVCVDHKDKSLPEMKCTCGEYLLIQKGKFGVFFNCMRCGNINLNRVLEMNPNIMKAEKVKEKVQRPEIAKRQETRHQTVRSDDPRYFR